MIKYFLLTILVFNVNAQEIDTLYYFNPDSLEMFACGFTDDVAGYGVYFMPNDEWESYSIKKIEFLMPDAKPYNIYEFQVAYGTETKPDTILYLFHGDTLFENEIFPNWKTIDLSSNSSLKNMTGNFWIQGIALAQTLCNLGKPSGHSYVYLYLKDQWAQLPIDYTVRIIIEENNVHSLEHNNQNNFVPTKPELRIYPNPFNSKTKIKLSITNRKVQNAIKATIYNIKGKKIRTFSSLFSPDTPIVLEWDGLAEDNQEVSSGVYLIRLEINKYFLSHKIILLK